MRPSKLLLALAAVAATVACDTSTDPVELPAQFIATLNGANERPTANTTTGSGVFAAQVHPTENTFSYTVSWSGLTGAITGAHIHGPADQASVANVLINFQALPAGSTNQTITTGATGSASGNVDLKLAVTGTVSGDSLIKLLDAGLLYVNVHTAANPGGEIRGQLARR
jgi:hypothetical protein